MAIIEFLRTHSEFALLVAGMLGLVVGSFLNVVIHRLPKMMEREWQMQCAELLGTDGPHADAQAPYSLSQPRSQCPHCGHPISALENIPVVSFALQRGRCRACKAPISWRYPAVELLSAILSIVVILHFGFGWQGLFAMVLTWALIALSVIDFDTRYLPDSITLPFLWLGIGANLFGVFIDLETSVIGAMAGYASLWLVFHLFKLLTGKEGMGFGDFKLLGMLGAWMGWQALPVIIIGASLVGSVFGIATLLARGGGRDLKIPFGPYLACAGWIALLWGNRIIDAYLLWIAPP